MDINELVKYGSPPEHVREHASRAAILAELESLKNTPSAPNVKINNNGCVHVGNQRSYNILHRAYDELIIQLQPFEVVKTNARKGDGRKDFITLYGSITFIRLYNDDYCENSIYELINHTEWTDYEILGIYCDILGEILPLTRGYFNIYCRRCIPHDPTSPRACGVAWYGTGAFITKNDDEMEIFPLSPAFINADGRTL